jgi:hypothetical protein
MLAQSSILLFQKPLLLVGGGPKMLDQCLFTMENKTFGARGAHHHKTTSFNKALITLVWVAIHETTEVFDLFF